MPMRSEKQRAWMWATHPRMARKWEEHTPKGKKLPKRVGKKKSIAKQGGLTAVQRIGSGIAELGRFAGSRKWADKITSLQARAEEGDARAQEILTMMGVASIALGMGAGMGLTRALGSGRSGLGAGLGLGLGVLPAAFARPEKRTPALIPMDSESSSAKMGSTGQVMAMRKTADLDKLDVKGISPQALQALMQGDWASALQHPGLVALAARRKERVRRLKDELYRPGSHLKRTEPKPAKDEQQSADNPFMPVVSAPAPPGGPVSPAGPIPPSNHLGLFGAGGMQGAPAGMLGGKQARVGAFKYGFFRKVAELGMLPSEFEDRLRKHAARAITNPAAFAKEAGIGKSFWRGLSGTTRDLLRVILFGIPLAGFLAGGALRYGTRPQYETPEDLQTIERIALFQRLGREARLRARRLQRKREAKLSARGEESKEPPVEVPEVATD